MFAGTSKQILFFCDLFYHVQYKTKQQLPDTVSIHIKSSENEFDRKNAKLVTDWWSIISPKHRYSSDPEDAEIFIPHCNLGMKNLILLVYMHKGRKGYVIPTKVETGTV